MVQFGTRGLMAGAALLMLVGGTAQAGTVTVYTALEEDEIADYVAAAKADLPDVELKVLRLSTGDLGGPASWPRPTIPNMTSSGAGP